MLDLESRHLDLLRSILRRHFPTLPIWAFGSRVTGTAKPYSDIDLVLHSETPISMRALACLEEDLADSDLPFRVDVVDWNSLPPTLRAHIEGSHFEFD